MNASETAISAPIFMQNFPSYDTNSLRSRKYLIMKSSSNFMPPH
jgi:hypothetical protein